MFSCRSLCPLIIACLLLFIIPRALLFAGGQREDPIDDARQLIAENRLNDAILVLQNIVRSDPERIEEAESLLRVIRELRGEYNVLLEQLVDNLVNNPGDYEGTLAIIERMEQIDRAPNTSTSRQVELARVLAKQQVDLSRAREILAIADDQIRAGEYAAAIQTYLGGFDLQLEEFNARGYGNIFVETVNAAKTQIRVASELFSEELAVVSENAESLREQLDGAVQETAAVQAAFDRLIPDLNAVTRQTGRVRDGGRTLANQLAQVPLMFPDDPVDYHLLFVSLFVVGPRAAQEPRGILGATSLAVDSVRSTIQQDLLDTGGSTFAEAGDAFMQSAWDRAVEQFGVAETLFGLAEDLILVSAGLDVGSERSVVVDVFAENAARREEYEVSWLNRTAADLMSALTNEQQAVSSLDRPDSSALPVMVDYRNTLEAGSEVIRGLVTQWENARRDSEVDEDGEVGERADYVSGRLAAAARRIVERETEAVETIARLQLDALTDRFGDQAELVRRAEELLRGVPQNQDEAAGDESVQVVFYYYPDEAIGLVDEALAAAEVLSGDIVTRDEVIGQEREEIRVAPQVVALRDEYDELQESLAALVERARELREQAESRIIRAQQLADEAVATIDDAEAALAANRIELARNSLQEASELFFESLELREDPELRDESFALIRTLGERIQDAEQQIVIREVRQLLIQATQLYTREEYVQAQTVLNQAEDRWETTMPEENPEITRIRLLVNAALQRLGGREITELDPLYRVLTQYLNVAQADYQRGRDLFGEGRETRGEDLFDRANENIQNVLSVRPLNWEAQVLRLRILQISESDNFDTIFENRYQDALAQINAGNADLNRVLTELEALYEINPDYPGLAGTIRQVEIDLGLRPDPVTQARVARSNQLLGQARGLANSSDRFERERAVAILDEAIELNPTNVDAQLLKDEILISIGAQASVALSPDDEQLYRRAESLYVEGRLGTAYDIVVRLLNDETNQRYPPLLDLRRRIESRLGI